MHNSNLPVNLKNIDFNDPGNVVMNLFTLQTEYTNLKAQFDGYINSL